MRAAFDLCVVGSGFAGSLLASIAQRLGRSVILLERGRHPRFAVGESSTPLANLLLQELAQRYRLRSLLPLTKWGTWQRTHPEIACGLKRGFTFYHHTFGQPFYPDPEHRNELLVAASPRDEIADTHWYRADFDYFLVCEAQKLGVEYMDECGIEKCRCLGESLELEGKRFGKQFRLKAHFVVDASGPGGFLHRAFKLGELAFENLPPTQALFNHFANVNRWADLPFVQHGLDSAAENGSQPFPPYPVDDAALHHVFDGGWIWILRFNNGLTSAGLAATDSLAKRFQLAEGKPAWDRLLQALPSVQEQFSGAEAQLHFVHVPRLCFRSKKVVGPGWALLPSAAGFVDPLLSTGFPLTLLGVGRLAEAIEKYWGRKGFRNRLVSYCNQTNLELSAAERLIAALYASMKDFSIFTSLSLLYFAATSFSETARRLGRSERAGSFLMCDHPEFGPRLYSCCQKALRAFANGVPALRERTELMQQIESAIEPFNLAGLGHKERRNWYPVESKDLLAGATKLGVARSAIEKLLVSSGFGEKDKKKTHLVRAVGEKENRL